jgi:hypothetical protein
MTSRQLSRRVAGVVAVAVALATATIFQGYGTGDVGSPAPPPDARCDAPLVRPSPGQATILAQIRYDSGLVLRYCGLQSMFAQLGALEQPGLVRAVHVLTSKGEWVDARKAHYVRGQGGVALAYALDGAAAISYAQLLRACARGDCGAWQPSN